MKDHRACARALDPGNLTDPAGSSCHRSWHRHEIWSHQERARGRDDLMPRIERWSSSPSCGPKNGRSPCATTRRLMPRRSVHSARACAVIRVAVAPPGLSCHWSWHRL